MDDWVLLGLFTRVWGMTQRQPHHRGSGACYTACRQLNMLDSVLSRCLSWSQPLPGCLASFCFFQTVSLVSVFFAAWLLSLRRTLSFYCWDTYWIFSDFPGCLSSCSGSFLAGWNVYISKETVTQQYPHHPWNSMPSITRAKIPIVLPWLLILQSLLNRHPESVIFPCIIASHTPPTALTWDCLFCESRDPTRTSNMGLDRDWILKQNGSKT